MKSACSRRNRFAVWTTLLLLGYSLSLLAATVEETFKKRIPFQEGGYLELSNSNGRVEIKSWDKNEVEIVAFKRVQAVSKKQAEEWMNKLKIEVLQTGDRIVIETITPTSFKSGGGFIDWLFGDGMHSFSVEFEIRVPKSIDMNISTTNGKIYCEQIKGRFRLHSTNGKITGREMEGLARCKTTNGSIDFEFVAVQAEEEINFLTTNGSIRIYLPENFSAQVNLKTTNGHIESDFPLTLQESWSKQHLFGTIGTGNSTLICNTTNGSIHLFSGGDSPDEDFSL
jgi:hypothetical protein